MTKEEQKAVEEFTEMNLTKKGLYHYNDMQDAFLIGLFKGENMQPSLPSDIDEAAEKYSENILANNEDLQDAIEDAYKTGGMLVAGQFQKIEGELVDWYSTSEGKDYCCGIKTSDPFVVPEGFYIRKKQ